MDYIFILSLILVYLILAGQYENWVTPLSVLLSVPLVFATGAGANARRFHSIAVCSGMLAATCLALVFVPVFYVLLQTWQEKHWGKPKK